MQLNELKTIDINAYEWFDKINGNSYFMANVTLNYGLKDCININLPFQYGYGSHFEEMSFKAIKEALKINYKPYGLSIWCRENNIILRSSKKENCKKKELLI